MSTSPRVLLIANNFPPVRGGSSVVYANIARCAAARIMVMAPSTNYVDGLVLIGWREHDRLAPYSVSRLKLLRTVLGREGGSLKRVLLMLNDMLIRSQLVWRLLKLIRQERIRAVCVGELLASSWLLKLLRYVPGVRSLVYVHGEEITTNDPYDPGSRRRRQALLAADQIIVVSQFTRKAVATLLGSDHADRILLIENGVDTTRFSPAPADLKIVERYGLQGYFVFITVCRLLEKKGVDHVLRALARLLPEHPETRYLIVGTGPFEPDLHTIVAELGIGHAVVFAGDVADHELVEHYRLSDVFVMPNRKLSNGDTEGFGLVFLEANSCGLPVIAGQDGGSVDAVRDGENGLVVNGHSVDAVYGAMLKMRTDDAQRERLAHLSLTAARRCDWSARAAAFLQACDGQA